MNIEIFEEMPFDFSCKVEVGACYLEVDDHLLLLQRSSSSSEPGTWTVPAGKIEKEETALEGMLRELEEETGIQWSFECEIQSLGCLYIRKPGLDYIFYLFAGKLDIRPSVQLSQEHQNYCWEKIENIPQMPLIKGGEHALKVYRKRLRIRAS